MEPHVPDFAWLLFLVVDLFLMSEKWVRLYKSTGMHANTWVLKLILFSLVENRKEKKTLWEMFEYYFLGSLKSVQKKT